MKTIEEICYTKKERKTEHKRQSEFQKLRKIISLNYD